ncbi:hypothetical protein CPE2_0330 [Chlamydia pecorum W73]|uniref:hypothetical protein n=1 Tax=Chlamydia pecorum TaxID=85991 RepID=UPI0003ADC06E|nr:hypothetical protein [Chlamydia pecorum]AGW38749.1 hypothetical protein CPE2_0330 [Chlamydia pecorum W73]
MPFFVIPAHNHTDPSGAKSLVKEEKIYLPPEHKWDPFFKLTPVIGLVYAVYLAYRACQIKTYVCCQTSYVPNGRCDNIECSIILRKSWGDCVTSLLGGTGLLILGMVIFAIFAVMYRALKACCC